MLLSYTQNMEDYHLWTGLGHKQAGTYVDIGSGHPIADNVSFFFYERGWKGWVVEPQRRLLDLHATIRPRDICINAVIGAEAAPIEFYEFATCHGLSTTSRSHADKAQSELGERYETHHIDAIPLARLFSQYDLQDVDFLKIDVEGAEKDVIASGDWNRHRPKIIAVEAIAPLSGEPAWSAWEPVLLAHGYRFMLFDTLNRFYVAEEQSDILRRFPTERAPWNVVRHMYEIGRAPENSLHPEHQLTQVLARGLWALLPFLDRKLVEEILLRGRRAHDAELVAEALSSIGGEAFSARLGRIACGYDGGQIDDTTFPCGRPTPGPPRPDPHPCDC